ncbi:MAG: Mrp/NBP35 family ATP-binding protein [Chloroflexi bacterium]|nr:Mrp/NBP35 family ATP-binding protein [Chloroflexota bacterium]
MADDKSTEEVSKKDVLAALSQIEDPDLHRDIVSLGFINDEDINICGGNVAVRIVLTTPACPVREQMKQQATELLEALPGIEHAEVDMDADVRATTMRGQKPVEGVRNIIAVASNKGGVGKSTVAVNLALALTKFGAKVGLMDADLTGPNLPTMMGVDAGLQADTGLSIVERYGVRLASIGFVLKKGLAVVWRGPMIGTGVRQLLHDMPWGAEGELDYLVIDLPPGTSDASMSMAQEAPIAGTVIVTTPNSVSLEDAMKAVMMFEKLQVPVFGVIENMSYFACPHCGERTDIFGHGGARETAEELGLDFLGEIPLDVAVRESSDSGVPIMVSAPDSPVAQAILEIAQKIAAKTSVQHFFAQTAAAS